MISSKIKNDISEEFENLEKSLQIHLKGDYNVSLTKEFLQKHIPNEIIYKSEILFDTLINYLIKDARNKIENADIQLQNAFFDADFRKRTHDWAKQLENQLALEPDIIQYTKDPRLVQGLIASSITLVGGTGITIGVASTVLGAIVGGLVTILLSAAVFKVAFDKATPKAREVIKGDIDKYLDDSQKQVLAWLTTVQASFEHDFREFCSTNGFVLEDK